MSNYITQQMFILHSLAVRSIWNTFYVYEMHYFLVLIVISVLLFYQFIASTWLILIMYILQKNYGNNSENVICILHQKTSKQLISLL